MKRLHVSCVTVLRWLSNAREKWTTLQLRGAVTLFAVPLFAAYAAEQPAPVTVTVVEKKTVDEALPLSGSVLARRRSQLSSAVDAVVAEMLIEEGDAVKSGAVLVRLDATLAELEMQRAAAALEEERTRHKEAIRRRDEAASMMRKKYVAETDYKARMAEVKMASAAIKRLQAEYRRRVELVERHIVRAPFAGVVSKKGVEVGEWAEAGSPLLELIEIDRLRIDVPVPQRYFSRIRLGSPVRLRFDALPGRHFDARVTVKIPLGHPAARTFPVRIEIDNRERLMAPGMSARVVFLLKPNESVQAALLLPRDAIVRLPDGSERVWRVEGDNGMFYVEPVDVATSRGTGALVVMKSGGLRQGNRIVVRGNESLTPGQSVRIVGHEKDMHRKNAHDSAASVVIGRQTPVPPIPQ